MKLHMRVTEGAFDRILARHDVRRVELCVDMGTRRQLTVIGLSEAICASVALTFDYEFFTVVFVLESAVANMLAWL